MRLGLICCCVWLGGGVGIVFMCGIIICYFFWLFMFGIWRVFGFFVCRCYNCMIVIDYLKFSDIVVMCFVVKLFN